MAQDILRKCIVCGQVFEKDLLLRFVLTPDNALVPDFKKKLPGKGVYVSNKKSLLTEAVEKGLFAKALKKKIKVDMQLVEQVENLLKKRALDAISLSRKAGDLVVGQSKVLEALKKKRVAFLLEAVDSGADGAKKIASSADDKEVFRLFKSEELDKELAKDSTVHLAFLQGHTTKMVREALSRLVSFLDDLNSDGEKYR